MARKSCASSRAVHDVRARVDGALCIGDASLIGGSIAFNSGTLHRRTLVLIHRRVNDDGGGGFA